ncbi:LysR family transcriptional regulator [Aeromicrobium camelliae]|uniref:LysR family transcriptional regulator n=1 Tax=Aeromicrobium camelliae TaxID=1538144 RepID=A0A3N6X3B5_9ACTN|nr:LysR family transcriptional regulator [Aeromicrobium camelliae]RQN08123.1 LysR family transcriptional regulator [Aeromicrobium camelliae]
MDVRRLMLLVEVLDRGSISAAAEALQYTPSAVSQQVKRLEYEVGQPLLSRFPRGVRATDAGLVLYRHACRIRDQLQAAQADVDAVAGLRQGHLRIGTFPTVGSSLLPLAVRAFKEKHPDVRLTVHSARFDDLVQRLHAGSDDVTLLWDYEWNRFRDDELDVVHLLDDATMLVVSADHRLARRRRVRLAELSEEEWVVREADHPVTEVLDRSARAAGFSPRISFRANDYQEAQSMVGVGLGVALAPRLAVVNRVPGVRVLSLAGGVPARRILVVTRRHAIAAPTEAAMLSTLREVADDLA